VAAVPPTNRIRHPSPIIPSHQLGHHHIADIISWQVSIRNFSERTINIVGETTRLTVFSFREVKLPGTGNYIGVADFVNCRAARAVSSRLLPLEL
jgi:hypothetical protein